MTLIFSLCTFLFLLINLFRVIENKENKIIKFVFITQFILTIILFISTKYLPEYSLEDAALSSYVVGAFFIFLIYLLTLQKQKVNN